MHISHLAYHSSLTKLLLVELSRPGTVGTGKELRTNIHFHALLVEIVCECTDFQD